MGGRVFMTRADYSSGFNHDTMKLANIIGNIYDNPELMEVKQNEM